MPSLWPKADCCSSALAHCQITNLAYESGQLGGESLRCCCSGQIVVSPTNIFHLFNNTTKLVEAMALTNNTQLPSQMVSMTVQASSTFHDLLALQSTQGYSPSFLWELPACSCGRFRAPQ